MSTTMKVTRRRLTVADHLSALDELTARDTERLNENVSKAEAALESAQAARRVRLADLAEKRAKIVADALAKADELKRQAGGGDVLL